MNNVEIMGGLGNQLFQYAFSRYLQKLGVKNVVLRKDFSPYSSRKITASQRESSSWINITHDM